VASDPVKKRSNNAIIFCLRSETLSVTLLP
jgi:hypothetical protein